MDKHIKVCIIGFIVIFVLSIFVLLTTSGCKSTGSGNKPGNISESITEHQAGITELESENEQLRGTIDTTADRLSDLSSEITEYNRLNSERLESIRKESSEIGGDVDKIINLFDRYNELVQQMLQQYDNLRKSVNDTQKVVDSGTNISSCNDSSKDSNSNN